MIYYLAGGVTGNLYSLWSNMVYHLAGNDGYHRQIDFLKEAMKVYLADVQTRQYMLDEDMQFKDLQILESYYYLRDNLKFTELISLFGSFLLDSGAFTFMSGSHDKKINWDEYLQEYAAFIVKYNIDLFFELDIDSIVGLKEVERLRAKLEKLTGKKPIPVWHKSRGKDYFIKMCQEYPYVAIGGIVTKEIPREIYEKGFPWFISTAHKYGAKIHGLGYSSLAGLHKYHFDSVDSTTWLHGNRGGYLYRFNPLKGDMDKIEGTGRLKARMSALNNFIEWVKFCRYAKNKL